MIVQPKSTRSEYKHQWYLANKEKAIKSALQWQLANPEKYREQNREASKRWKINNPEKSRESVKHWQLANPEKQREYEQRRYWKDPVYHRLKATARKHKCLPELLKQILERDRCCQNCWIHEDLTFDHIIPISKGGKTEYDNLQILCKSCNSRKGNQNEKR